jgi:hypothetical protein
LKGSRESQLLFDLEAKDKRESRVCSELLVHKALLVYLGVMGQKEQGEIPDWT